MIISGSIHVAAKDIMSFDVFILWKLARGDRAFIIPSLTAPVCSQGMGNQNRAVGLQGLREAALGNWASLTEYWSLVPPQLLTMCVCKDKFEENIHLLLTIMGGVSKEKHVFNI